MDSVCIAVTGYACFSLLPVPEPKSHYNVLILLAIVVYVSVALKRYMGNKQLVSINRYVNH